MKIRGLLMEVQLSIGPMIHVLEMFEKGTIPGGVFEADESDRSLLHFHPEWAVITNFSKDHFLLDEVSELFGLFAAQVQKCIVCGPGVAVMLRNNRHFSSMPEIIDVDVDPIREGFGWTVSLEGRTWRAPMPGRHNALNAALCVAYRDRRSVSTPKRC